MTTEVAGRRFPDAARGGPSAVGSMPGGDPAEAAAVVVGELGEPPGLPSLPELPGRGPGADLIGRAAALLVDLPVDREPSGWRLVARPGLDARRAASYLSQDLDAFEEALQGRAGPVKVAVAGPWTLAAALQLPRGEPVLSDPGAVRDLVQGLAEGVTAYAADLRRRLPGSEVVVQLDEPSLPAVLLGRVRSSSGYRAIDAVPDSAAEDALRDVLAAAGGPAVVHCCAADPPVELLHRAGAAGLSLDLTLVGDRLEDALGAALEAGVVLLAGVVPSTGTVLSDPATTVGPVRRLWQRLGLDLDRAATSVVVTPTCGLAGAGPDHARRALRLARAAARTLVEDPERED